MTTRTKRVGPRMAYVRLMASQPGGIPIIDAAQRVGPNGSLKYGYETVNRAIRAGLVIVGRPVETARRGRFIFTID